MFERLLRLHRLTEDEAPADGGDGGGGGGDGGGQGTGQGASSGAEGGATASLLDRAGAGAGGGEGGEGGQGGEGGDDPPDWFKADKYKSVEDQAKAYAELEKRFGAFTGAPEGDYELALPDDLAEVAQIKDDDPKLKEFLTFAKEAQASPEFVNKAMEFHARAMQEALSEFMPDPEAEIASLGQNADRRLKDIADWGQANLAQDQFEALKAATTTAAGVQLIEALISKSRNAPLPNSDTAHGGSSLTAADLRAMRSKTNDKGERLIEVDADYRAQVDRAYREFYGEQPYNEVVSPSAR